MRASSSSSASLVRPLLLALLLAVVQLLCRAPLSSGQSVVGPVYFCWLSYSDPAQTSSPWSESMSGYLNVNWAQLTAYSASTYSVPVTSISGNRVYTTQSTTYNTTLSLGSSGTDGSNNQLLVYIHYNNLPSSDSRQLDATGITFQLGQAQPLAGSTSMVSTLTIKWNPSVGAQGGNVEVSGGVSAQYSQYTSWSPQVTNNTASLGLPQCQAQSSATSLSFTYCVQCWASNYSQGDWQMQHWGVMSVSNPSGALVSRATHQELDTNSVVLGITGVRWFQQAPPTYTDIAYPPATSVITGLQGVWVGDGGPDNKFMFAAPWLNGNGYTYNLYPNQPLGNFGGNYSDINFYYNGYGIGWGDYREVNEPNHESVCAFEQSSYTYSLYQLGTDPQAVCQATIQPPKVWAFCATMFDNTGSLQWGAAYSGYMVTTGLPFTDLAYSGLPVYFTKSVRGTRAYRNYATSYTETANIVFLQPQGGDAGTDNLFYYPSISPFASVVWNRNGISVTFDRNVTEAGTSTKYPDLNLYYNGRLRETNDNTALGVGGGFHEDVGCIGNWQVVPWTGVMPSCPLPSTVPACPTATQQFDLCYLAYGPSNSWSVAISAVVTGTPFQYDYGANGGGYREYTTVTGVKGTRTYYDSSLNPSAVSISGVGAGGLLYSVSSPYSYISPGALVNSTGLTFNLASAATIPGASSSSTVQLYSPSVGVYTENAGSVPSFSYMRHTFLSPAGQRACQPSYAPAGCSASSSLPAGSVSMQLTLTSPSYSTLAANSVFGPQLMEDLAFSLGTGQLYALPLLSCGSVAQSGSNTVVTVYISNAANNATQLATAAQAAVASGGLTTRLTSAVASTAILPLTYPGSSSSTSSSSSGLSGGQIAGIVIGSVVGGLLLLAVCLLVKTRANKGGGGDVKGRQRMEPSEESQRSARERETTEMSNHRA